MRSSPAARRIALLAPPLLVGVGVAWVLLRGADDGARERAEADVRVRWLAPAEFAALERDLDAYVEEHGGRTESRWFAAEAFARIGRFHRAHETVWKSPETAARPETPGRFARLLLERLPDVPGAEPNRLGPRTLVARVEAGLPGAAEALAAVVRGPEFETQFRLLFESASLAGRGARTTLAEALAERPEEEFDVAADNLVAGPARRDGIDRLVRAASDPALRRSPGALDQVVRALGATTDPRAVDALRSLRERALGEEDAPRARLADVGLAIAGDADGRARLGPLLSDGEGALWASGLGARLAGGDASAAADALDLWERNPGPLTRRTLAAVTLLADDPPPAAVPAERFADDLRRTGDPLLRTLADAYAWRATGAPPALDALTAAVGEALLDPRTTARDAHGLSGSSGVLLEALRAWARWPTPPARER